MDLSKKLSDTLLGNSSLNALSETSGADKDQVRQVLSDALPVFVRSMQKNASTKSGEEALSKALSDHAKDDAGDIGSFLKNADLDDGAKILTHILGGNKKPVETAIAKKSGLSSNQTSTILSAAAPLLLNLLGSKKDEEDEKDSGGILGILASALLGGGDGKDDSGGILGMLASSLLGGGDGKDDGSNNLGNIIGSLLGGAGKKTQSSKKTKKKTQSSKKTNKKKPYRSLM